MYRNQLLHVILELGERFGLKGVFVVGSAAILAAMPEPPDGALTATRDVDVIPPDDEHERVADQISFVIGEASPFDEEYGYYAQGVSLRTPTYAPRDWQSRTIPVSVGKIVARCMDPHDLVLSKLGAGRPKDLEFARAASALGLVTQEGLLSRVGLVGTTPDHASLMIRRIASLSAHP